LKQLASLKTHPILLLKVRDFLSGADFGERAEGGCIEAVI
jgi:hypothetical protein